MSVMRSYVRESTRPRSSAKRLGCRSWMPWPARSRWLSGGTAQVFPRPCCVALAPPPDPSSPSCQKRRFPARKRCRVQPFDSCDPVKAGVRRDDLPHAQSLHHRRVEQVTSGQLRVSVGQDCRSLDVSRSDSLDTVRHQRSEPLKYTTSFGPTSLGQIAVDQLLEHLRVRDERVGLMSDENQDSAAGLL